MVRKVLFWIGLVVIGILGVDLWRTEGSSPGGPIVVFEPVHVRIYGSGLVERDTVETIRGQTFFCPIRDSDKTLHISPASAKDLLEEARDQGFCRLCAIYQDSDVLEGGHQEVRLRLRGKVRTVWNHSGNPPPVFHQLVDRIWTLSEIQSLADIQNFPPDRQAECRKFEDAH